MAIDNRNLLFSSNVDSCSESAFSIWNLARRLEEYFERVETIVRKLKSGGASECRIAAAEQFRQTVEPGPVARQRVTDLGPPGPRCRTQPTRDPPTESPPATESPPLGDWGVASEPDSARGQPSNQSNSSDTCESDKLAESTAGPASGPVPCTLNPGPCSSPAPDPFTGKACKPENLIRAGILALSPDAGDLIPILRIEASTPNRRYLPAGSRIRAAVDVAQSGGDDTAIALRSGAAVEPFSVVHGHAGKSSKHCALLNA